MQNFVASAYNSDKIWLDIRIVIPLCSFNVLKVLTKEELDLECSKCICIKTDDTKKAAIILEKELKTTNYKVIDQREIRLYDYLDHANQVNKALATNDVNVMSIIETGISLEDYFITILKEAN